MKNGNEKDKNQEIRKKKKKKVIIIIRKKKLRNVIKQLTIMRKNTSQPIKKAKKSGKG